MILQRTDYRADGIFSDLINGETIYKTLDHSYDCMPKLQPGIYNCVRGMHQLSHGPRFETFEITGVPHHTGMLFHVGNFQRDSDGCILVGRTKIEGSIWMVTGSRDAFGDFMVSLDGVGSFQLEVIA